MTEFESKHGIVSRQPHELYMAFTDLSNFKKMLPADKQAMIVLGVGAQDDKKEMF